MPDQIILIRHGESEANVNEEVYLRVPDHKICLTKNGEKQAIEAGKKLREMVGKKSVRFFHSPYTRAKQTLKNISKGGNFNLKNLPVQEDPRLREQEWGTFADKEEREREKKEWKRVGKYFYRFKNGENCADVVDRAFHFSTSLFKKFRVEASYCERNYIIVSHGQFICCFLMKVFKIPVESFENIKHPHNCQMVILKKDKWKLDGEYLLQSY